MKKTVRQWIAEFNEPYRTLIHTNHEEQKRDTYVGDIEVSNPATALGFAFDFRYAKEGEDFWQAVSRSLPERVNQDEFRSVEVEIRDRLEKEVNDNDLSLVAREIDLENRNRPHFARSIQEWYQLLDEPSRSWAIENFHERLKDPELSAADRYVLRNAKVDSMFEALDSGFDFDVAKRGNKEDWKLLLQKFMSENDLERQIKESISKSIFKK